MNDSSSSVVLNVLPEHEDNLKVSLAACVTALQSHTVRAWIKTFCLRFVFHQLGDMHQPLHCAEFYNATYPNGTHTGLQIKVVYSQDSSITDLHVFWDTMGGLYAGQLPLPVDSAYIDMMERNASALIQEFPASSFPNLNTSDYYTPNITDWVLDGYNLAVEYGYKMISQPPNSMSGNSSDVKWVISAEYAEIVQRLTRQRIALAAYRLARLLNTFDYGLYGPLPPPPPAGPECSTTPVWIPILVIVAFVLTWPVCLLIGCRMQRSRTEQHKPFLETF